MIGKKTHLSSAMLKAAKEALQMTIDVTMLDDMAITRKLAECYMKEIDVPKTSDDYVSIMMAYVTGATEALLHVSMSLDIGIKKESK